MNDHELRGKVAAVLDNREIAINLGTDAGVEVGDRFAVLSPTQVPVTDPDSGVTLGYVDYAKTVVKVVRVVGPRLSIARTFRTVKGRPSVLGSNFSGTPDRVETLNVDPQDTIKANAPDELSRVRVGDIVTLAIGDAYMSD